MKISEIIKKKPFVKDFFEMNGLELENITMTIESYVKEISLFKLEHLGIDRKRLISDYYAFIKRMDAIKESKTIDINSITIEGGCDKDGNAENEVITIKSGEIVCLNGVTGSGKSRLLEDIEWLANGDTPTKRKIKINNELTLDTQNKFGIRKLVAQLSQNMNFVMDVSVEEFINYHGQSRLINVDDCMKNKILKCANELSGEKFNLNTPLTLLSGGQSRALMIADIVFLCTSPIILLDEIENAGIDKMKVLKLLSSNNKIVLMATHDPVLALSASRRIVMVNGGISKVVSVTTVEKDELKLLMEMDKKLYKWREKLRDGS